MYSQKTTHTSPYRASYGMFVVNILQTSHCVIRAPHCSQILKIGSERTMSANPWFKIMGDDPTVYFRSYRTHANLRLNLLCLIKNCASLSLCVWSDTPSALTPKSIDRGTSCRLCTTSPNSFNIYACIKEIRLYDDNAKEIQSRFVNTHIVFNQWSDSCGINGVEF